MNAECSAQFELVQILARLRRRQRALYVLDGLLRGTFVGSIIGLGIAGFASLMAPDWLRAYPWAPCIAVAVMLLGGILVGWLKPVDDLRVSRSLDRKAGSEDRFASAVQLRAHRNQHRAALVLQDAIHRVSNIPTGQALPVRIWRGAKWIGLPLLLMITIILITPASVQAVAPAQPEITASEWEQIQRTFEEDLREFPKPETDDEGELNRQLDDLSTLLSKKPDKKEALAAIARVRDQLEQRQKAAGTKDFSMKKAARSLSRSEALKKLAERLRQGDYQAATKELSSLSKQLDAKELTPTADEFQQMAADLEQLAMELASMKELQQAAEQCANAANSMNRASLAEAMRRMAEQLQRDAQSLRQCDRANDAQSMLDRLQRMLNQSGQCDGCKDGCASCSGNNLVRGDKNGKKQGGANKGGLEAGRGTMRDWLNGTLGEKDEQRVPDLANTPEGSGSNTSFKVVSKDERAESVQSYEELFADLVHQAEADLDLESLPVSYREYLRRYFRSIQPTDDSESAPQEADVPSASTEHEND